MTENLQEQFEKVKKLDELCQILSKQDSPACDWFHLLDENRLNADPFTSIAFLDTEEKNQSDLTVGFIPKLFTTLHECILNLRWREVLRVINTLVHMCHGSSHTLWKVGNELVQRNKSERLVRKLFEQTKHLTDIGAKEIVLEFVFYLMSCDRHESALANIQENVTRAKNVGKDRNEKGFYVGRLTRAYTGLLYYLEWKSLHKKMMQSQQDILDPTLGVSLLMPTSFQPQQLEMRMNNCASKAILCFQELIGQPGVWDIFVTTYVELLVYKDNTDEALTVLQQYAELNPHNPNAHKYLYALYKQHFPESESTLKQLRVIAEKIPSDSLVLELCEQLQKDDLGQACSHLFTLLDYASWQNVLAPWKMLGGYLKTILVEKSCGRPVRKQVQRCWKARHTWWPQYHFTIYHVKADLDTSLLFHKALVAGLLLGNDNNFTQKSQKVMSLHEQKKLKKVLDKT